MVGFGVSIELNVCEKAELEVRDKSWTKCIAMSCWSPSYLLSSRHRTRRSAVDHRLGRTVSITAEFWLSKEDHPG
jgi:hypothetical protein